MKRGRKGILTLLYACILLGSAYAGTKGVPLDPTQIFTEMQDILGLS